jgi:hypothetical protein
MLIALTGYAGAGKDTVGQILVEQHGFTRVSFAAALKAMAVKLDPILELPADDDDEFVQTARLSEVIHAFGGSLEDAKQVPAVRAFLQHLGTEVVRETFGRDAGVQAARLPEALAEHGKVVITDCRFRNEAQAVVDLGGKVARVTRPGVGAINAHASEHDLAGWPIDFELWNDGSLEQLATNVRVALNVMSDRISR